MLLDGLVWFLSTHGGIPPSARSGVWLRADLLGREPQVEVRPFSRLPPPPGLCCRPRGPGLDIAELVLALLCQASLFLSDKSAHPFKNLSGAFSISRGLTPSLIPEAKHQKKPKQPRDLFFSLPAAAESPTGVARQAACPRIGAV